MQMDNALVKFASAVWTDLTFSEARLLTAIGQHAVVECRGESIRASVVRWLCVNTDLHRLVDAKGVRIVDARITGPLDLDSAAVPFPLTLQECSVTDGVDLRD